MIKPWRKISSAPLRDFRIFSVRSDRRISPRTGREHEFFVIDAANWVNVVALTAEGQMVLIEQFRHGTGTIELEIPGGVIDAGDGCAEAAGCRELREETGYEGVHPQIIGQVFPNPAIMSNTCFTVLVENCRRLRPVKWDSAEDLITRLVPIQQVPGLIASGQIRHALIIAALYDFELWRRKVAAVKEPRFI